MTFQQDWEFPHFMGDVDVNLPGLHTPHMQFKIPFFQKIFKEEYRIHITGMLYDFQQHLTVYGSCTKWTTDESHELNNLLRT